VLANCRSCFAEIICKASGTEGRCVLGRDGEGHDLFNLVGGGRCHGSHRGRCRRAATAENTFSELGAQVNVLAVLAVLTASSKVQAANSARWDVEDLMLNGCTVLVELLKQTSSERHQITWEFVKLGFRVCNAKRCVLWNIGTEERNGLRAHRSSVAAPLAAGDNTALLLPQVFHVIAIYMYLKASILRVATAFLKQAAKGQVLLKLTGKPLVTTLCWHGLVKRDLKEAQR